MKEKRIFDILTHYLETKPEQDIALSKKVNGKWINYSIRDYVEHVNAVSSALIELGVGRGEKIAIINSNCPEWNILDMAIMQVGAITVPIYPTITKEDYECILNDCGAKLIFADGNSVLQKVESVRENVKSIEKIYTFTAKEGYESFNDILEFGRQHNHQQEVDAIKESIKESDCATIVYTSGTTGVPKGVMIAHSNIMKQIEQLIVTPAKWSNKAFSFLPLCHAYERLMVFLYQYLTMSVYYAENLATIVDNMREIHPTFMTCVPRILEKMYLKVSQMKHEMKGISKYIFIWAMNLAEKYTIDNRSCWYNLKHAIADKLVYSKIREKVGGENFDIIVSGAASLPRNISAFFSAIRMPVYEGYGLTECSPVIATSSNVPYGREVGYVGPAIPGVEVKIAENGEIICRGYNVMMGYYNKPELTAEVIDKDGWFHTGDLGEFNEHGNLRITGRIKNLFKTSLGKYINPEVIENKFAESGFIEHIVVLGENQKFAAAIIIPDFAFLRSWCKRHEIKFTTPKEMITNPQVKARFAEEIKKINANFGDTEKIKRYELLADEWTPMNGILTPTLKVKRPVVKKEYKELIDKIFS